MNQQLEDLMYRAGLTADGCWDQLDQYDRDAIVRLVELVVRACGDFTDPVTRNLMMKHFGVE
jgi:hypothetical protein